MNPPFLELTRTKEGWQASFAFQVFHRSGNEWIKMRWGFNASALLDEALDRHKLFIEAQAVHEAEFHRGFQPNNTLALRGINLPGTGVQMGILGKSISPEQEEARQSALNFARKIFSIFPHDFILVPASSVDDYYRLVGHDLLADNPEAAQIQRGMVFLPSTHGYQHLTGFWQTGSRSNEQIWRALSAMPRPVLFNVILQPSILVEGEKKVLLEIKKEIKKIISKAEEKDENTDDYIPWVEHYIKRRLSAWKKFFLLQVHLLAIGVPDENLLRSIGSAITRDSNDSPLPGFQMVYPNSIEERQEWCEKIRSLDFVTPAFRVDDLADLDEVYSVFRFPYRPEAGLPGTNFVPLKNEPPPVKEG